MLRKKIYKKRRIKASERIKYEIKKIEFLEHKKDENEREVKINIFLIPSKMKDEKYIKKHEFVTMITHNLRKIVQNAKNHFYRILKNTTTVYPIL